MATKKELLELLERVVNGCTVWIDDHDKYGGGYTVCPWCYCEGYSGTEDHYKDCLYYDIMKVL